MHINDSKTTLGSKKDRHEHIGQGHIGLEAFRHIVTDPRTQNMPLTLETPKHGVIDVERTEIEVLNRMSILDDKEWLDQKESLQSEIATAISKVGDGKKKWGKSSTSRIKGAVDESPRGKRGRGR